jgi:hypothetical protein
MLGVLTDVPICCCKNGYKIGYLIEKNVKKQENTSEGGVEVAVLGKVADDDPAAACTP